MVSSRGKAKGKGDAMHGKHGVRSILVGACLLSLLLAGGCYDPRGPVPEGAKAPVTRDYTQEEVDAVVTVELQEIHSPLPPQWGAPPECDWIQFLRFRPSDGSTLGTKPGYPVNLDSTDAMLLMMPGILEGANGFEYIGRQLVYRAKLLGKNIEVWAVDRRNNRVEDLTGMEAAEREAARILSEGGTPEQAAKAAKDICLGYYYGGAEIDGKKFKGVDWYLNEKNVRFLSEFGLKMDTEDMFKIIMTMVPDREVRKQKVFVGGHSLGGIHTSMFAGWDLDGDPGTTDDAGYENCAGLFAFDSTVTPVNYIVDDYIKAYAPFLPKCVVDAGKNLTRAVYDLALAGMRSGVIPNLIPTQLVTGNPIDPEIMAIIEPMGMLAFLNPQGSEAVQALKEIPLSKNMKELLRNYISRNKEHYDFYYSGYFPRIEHFKFTNRAFLGLLFDDDFTHIGMIRVSMGFMGGGAVVPKDENTGYEGLFVPIDAGPDYKNLGKGPVYDWVNFNQVADAGDPLFQDGGKTVTYTNLDNEVADMSDFARALFQGPTNLTEWGFSTRRLVDIMGAIMSYGPCYGLNFIHADKVGTLPKIEFIAEEGVLDSFRLSYVSPPIKGYNHMDPMFASANTSSRRENDVIAPLLSFVGIE
jgi:hypothetical protein